MKVIRIITNADQVVIPAGMSRVIKYCTIHCTAGPINQTTQEIFNYWQKNNGWTNPGYHFDIAGDGTIEQLVELNNIANGVAGHNANNIHVCCKGGIDAKGNPIDNRTDAQKRSLLMIITQIKHLFPNVIILGHRDFSVDKNGDGILESWEWIKSCPSYDVREWLASVGFEKVIEPARIVYKLNKPLIKNDTVSAIQAALNLKIDGWFGEGTSNAVKAFQKAENLTADGIVGEGTAAFLAKKILPGMMFLFGDRKMPANAVKELLFGIKNNTK